MLFDRVRDQTTTAGLGAYTISGVTATGDRTIVAAVPAATEIEYAVTDGAGTWEINTGVFDGVNQLTRGNFEDSSTGAAINWPNAAAKTVFIGASARAQVYGLAQSLGTTGGTANAQTLTPAPAIQAYRARAHYCCLAGVTNTGGPCTLNISGKGARSVKKVSPAGLVDPEAGDITLGGYYKFYDDGARLQLLNPTPRAQTGYLFGGTLSNDGGAPTTTIDIAAGRCADVTGNWPMVWAAFTKVIQAAGAWAAGSGGNGLFTGARAASTWYHVFAIVKTADGSVDFGFDTSVTAANIPAGYSSYRRLGSVKTDGASSILAFSQFAGQFLWLTPVIDVAAAAIGVAAVTPTLSIPLGVRVFPIIGNFVQKAAAAPSLYVSSPDATDVTALANYDTAFGIAAAAVSASVMNGSNVRSNTSSQLRFRADNAGCNYTVSTYGWIDDLGRSA